MKTWSQVIPVNFALTAVGLRVELDPWPALEEVPRLAPGKRSLGPLYSQSSRSSPVPWARYRAQSSIRTRRRSNRSERA